MPAEPAKALLRDVRAFGFGADQCGIARAVALAEGVPARRQRERLLVVHRHPREGLADVAARLRRISIAAGALGVDVDEAHLDRRERVFEHPPLVWIDSGLAACRAGPFLLGDTIKVLFR